MGKKIGLIAASIALMIASAIVDDQRNTDMIAEQVNKALEDRQKAAESTEAKETNDEE